MLNKPVTVSKRTIWNLIQKDSFLTMLAKKFKCQGAVIKGKTWSNGNQRKRCVK